MISWDSIRKHLNSRKPICLFDFPYRENETDVVFIGNEIDAQNVDFLRRTVGGPLAVYVQNRFLHRIGILTFKNLIEKSDIGSPLIELVTHGRSHDPRFAISIDARDNKTGCSCIESAQTINVLYDLLVLSRKISDEKLIHNFVKRLKSPGHVPLIKAADGLLKERKGHAELAISIAQKLIQTS